MATNIFNSSALNERTHDLDCVFISHQKVDALYAKAIAEYLISEGINVYFDEYDKSIDRSNPCSVVAAIERGIRISSHLLCVFSQQTLFSKWVPWELGYAKCKGINSVVLRINNIKKELLPEYIQITRTINNADELILYVKQKRNITESVRVFSRSHKVFDYIDR